MKKLIALLVLTAQAEMFEYPAQAESARTNTVIVTPDYLTELAEEMRTNNPALRAAAELTNAAAAGMAAVRTWEDPMFMVGGMAAGKSMRYDDGDVIYGVEQKLPLFGKASRERDVAKARFAAETAGQDYKFQKMRLELARAAFRAALASRVVAIGEQDLAWLDTTKELLETTARAGKASLVEILQIQNERAKRSEQLQTDRNQLAQAKISLNRLMNRAAQSPWPEFELPPVAGAVVFNPRLVEFALKYEPKTAVMQQQVKEAGAMLEATRRQRVPDVSVGIEARNSSRDGSFRQGMFTLRMNLPWFNNGKIRSDITREQSRLSAIQLELADEQLAIREELHLLTTKIDAARREALLYRDQIIPRTATAMNAVHAGWQSGQNTFREVLDAHRMLLDARLMETRAVAEQYQMLSELVLCCGIGDLNALQMIGAEPPVAPATK